MNPEMAPGCSFNLADSYAIPESSNKFVFALTDRNSQELHWLVQCAHSQFNFQRSL